MVKGSQRNITTSPKRKENRTPTGTQADVCTAVLRPIRDQPAPAHIPHAQGATNSVAMVTTSPRSALSPGSKLESCIIEKGKLVIDWDNILGRVCMLYNYSNSYNI